MAGPSFRLSDIHVSHTLGSWDFTDSRGAYCFGSLQYDTVLEMLEGFLHDDFVSIVEPCLIAEMDTYTSICKLFCRWLVIMPGWSRA